MSSVLPFDALTLSIDGTNLIEASAGTGKTYGIAALFTRLIVLEKKDIEKILVVTFTKAATAELKTRLRARLDEVLQVLNEIQTLGGKPEHISDGLKAICKKPKPSFKKHGKKFAANWKTWKKRFGQFFPNLTAKPTKEKPLKMFLPI